MLLSAVGTAQPAREGSCQSGTPENQSRVDCRAGGKVTAGVCEIICADCRNSDQIHQTQMATLLKFYLKLQL